jgi:hypothetical protein
MYDPQQPDANVQVASGAGAGSSLAFKVSGEGTLQARQENAGAPSAGGSAQSDNRPGGGLGPPIDAPDPLQKYRWWILGGFAAALVIGGVFIASRQQAANRARGKGAVLSDIEDDDDYEIPEPPREARPAPARRPDVRPLVARPSEARAPESRTAESRTTEDRPQPAPRRSSSSMLLEGLKDELFELEVEHKQGRISQQEYEKTKAALDQTLERALKREAQKA